MNATLVLDQVLREVRLEERRSAGTSSLALDK